MKCAKVKKLLQRLEELRRHPATIKHDEMRRFAEQCGRELMAGRGKERVYRSIELPNARPLAIPGHAGKDLKVGTARNILDSLESDLLELEENCEP